MPCVYILKSLLDGNSYIGSTINLEQRLEQHRLGKVKSTKYRLPIELFATREFQTIAEAVTWEKKYKRSHGQLERDIKKGKLVLIHGV